MVELIQLLHLNLVDHNMENNLPQGNDINGDSNLADSLVDGQDLGKKKLLISILIFGIVFVLGIGVSIIILIIPKDKQNSSASEKKAITEVSPATVLTQANNSDFEYKIIEGSIYKIYSNEEKEIFLDENSLQEYERDNQEIVEFGLSPDKSKMLVHLEIGITPFILYYIDIKKRKNIIIGPSVESIWSPDSRYIAHTYPPADAGPKRLYVYDTTINDFVNTDKPENSSINYSNLTWSSDSKSIYADFERRDDIPNGNIIDKGKTQIKLN